MGAMTAARLSERATLRLAGADAAQFLNGLVTSEVETLPAGAARLAALLTPQGKILFDFLVLRAADGFIVDCHAAQPADLVRRLGLYKLRARVDIADASAEHAIIAVWGGKPPSGIGLFAFEDPRHASLGWRIIARTSETGAVFAALGVGDAGAPAYRAHRIALGIAEGGADYGSGELFPHEACMDQLGGVSFTKGCFIGQEVVSRMEHRGTARSRVLPFTSEDRGAAKGEPVSAHGKSIGMVLATAGRTGLALVRLDRLGTARDGGHAARAGDAVVRLVKPAWARFDVPHPGAR